MAAARGLPSSQLRFSVTVRGLRPGGGRGPSSPLNESDQNEAGGNSGAAASLSEGAVSLRAEQRGAGRAGRGRDADGTGPESLCARQRL